MSNNSLYDDPYYFGPAANGRFDFTVFFESTILSILPSAIFLLLFPARARWLYKQPRKVTESILLSNKLLFLAAFSVMQLALLVLWATSSSTKSQATLAAAGLSAVVALGLCLLSHAEHIRSIKPSAIINTYLLFTTIFDITRARTLWLEGDRKVASAFSSALAIKLLIMITESMEKRDILLSQYQHNPPEATSGIYSRSFFWWLNTLLRTGFRKVLTNEDLYPIDEEMASISLRDELWRRWISAKKERKYSLLLTTMWALRWPLFSCVLPRVALIGFKYAQPFLIQRTIEFVNMPKEADNVGWGLTAAFGLVFAGMGISNGVYYHMSYRFVTALRGSLIGVIYAKTVDLSITALDESAAITLMSTDTQTICLAFVELQEVWAVFVEISIAFFLLFRQVGISFVAVAVVALGSIAATLTLAKHMGRAQEQWIKAIQTRVDATAAMLGSMKAVKMLGFTEHLAEMVQALRVKELKLSTLFRRLVCMRVFLGNGITYLAPLALFTVFVLVANATGVQLDTAKAYTSLSLITLVANPCNILIWVIPQLFGSLACFERIEKFLKSDARRDHRLKLHSERSSVSVISCHESDVEPNSFPLNPVEVNHVNDRGAIIEVQNASFGWNESGAPAVNDVSFRVERSNLTFIIGAVGCGKSTLLKGILGETRSSKGFVHSVSQHAAYCEQTPWIQNGTIQQNILGLSSLEEPWYSTVVHACALEQDIAIFPKGHATAVGSAGISLSGGQKQRLALARAVYSRKSLIILDDIFSGLDADTEEKVFNRLLGKKGLLRRSKTTVILVTHAVSRLPYADHIITMNSEGSISEQGTFDQLRQSGGYVQSLEAKHKVEDLKEKDEPTGIPSNLIKNSETQRPEEELKRQVGDLSVYNYYFKSIGWLSTSWFLSWAAILSVAGGMSQLLLTFWTNAIAQHGNSVNAYYLGLFGLCTAISCIGLIISAAHFLMSMIPSSAEKLHYVLLQTVMAAPLSFFTKTDTGVTTNRFSQDMSIVDMDLPYALIDCVFSVLMCIVGGALMCLSAGYFAAVLPPVILMVWILQKYYLRTSRQLRILDLEAKSPLYSHFIESLSGLATIRAFGWASDFEDRNLTLLDASQKPYYLLFCVQRWLALVLDLMVASLSVILMVFVVKLRAEVSAGFVGLALLNVMGFNESLAAVIRMWTSVETSIGAISRLKTFSAETESENLPRECASVPESWPAHGAIEFSNLTASYNPSFSDPVLQNVNLTICAGEKIGICGRSGSGKSSLITTLFRMLEIAPTSSITIDGMDITTLPRQLVRSRLNAIPQEPFFMRGTIRYNADPLEQRTTSEISTALSKVHLLDLVLSKGGLETPLDAEFFSHGQRQLFCLARAILRESRIVVLDEATSSVDKRSDELMQKVIREEFCQRGCTVLAVAHRLDTILDFDRIVLLSEGEIVECDTPEALLGRESRFRELYNS